MQVQKCRNNCRSSVQGSRTSQCSNSTEIWHFKFYEIPKMKRVAIYVKNLKKSEKDEKINYRTLRGENGYYDGSKI